MNPRPEEMRDPPAIDPGESAIESSYWDGMACHLVHHEGRYYAWIVPSGTVFPMPGEEAARGFLADWQAANLLHMGWSERIASVFVMDPEVILALSTRPQWSMS